jgi:hypothetical protein
MPNNNPFTEATRQSSRAERLSRIDVGTVDGSPEGDGHTVPVRFKDGRIRRCEIQTRQSGDYAVPPEGAIVHVRNRSSGLPTVVAAPYESETDVPDLEPGERRIGHPNSDAHVDLLDDGTVSVAGDDGTTVEIHPDGTVSIDDGTQGIVTDVTGVDSDGDGNLESVDVTRDDTILI